MNYIYVIGRKVAMVRFPSVIAYFNTRVERRRPGQGRDTAPAGNIPGRDRLIETIARAACGIL